MKKPRKHYGKKKNPHYYGRHNPLNLKGDMTLALWGSGGAVATRALTQLALQARNVGAFGYIGNGITAFALGWAGDKLINPAAGTGLFVGGLISTVLRIAKEKLFAGAPLSDQLQLSGLGDVDFGLKGYVSDPFLLPTTSTGEDMLTSFPPIPNWQNPPARAAAGMGAYYSGSRPTVGVGPVIDRYNPTWG